MRCLALTYVLALLSTAAAAEPPPDAPKAEALARDARGLLLGTFDPAEPKATTREEAALGLRPHPAISQTRGFWLQVPQGYDREKPPPLLIVLHPRGPLKRFNTRTALGGEHLAQYAAADLAAWGDAAAKAGFLLALPVGDPDILWMGVSWQTRDRGKLVESLLAEIGKTHAFDPRRVFLFGTGEGGHAAIATAIRHGEMIAAAAACNPPLFDGASRRGKHILPETVDEMLKEASERKPPLQVIAGNRDKSVGMRYHSVGSVAADRFQDDGPMALDHVRKMIAILQKAEVPVDLADFDGSHTSPLPKERVAAVVEWFARQAVPAPPPEQVPEPPPHRQGN